ncbi:ribonuclease R [Planktomarina temperata]|nr:ribonuclease R [Planktomarina temperata]
MAQIPSQADILEWIRAHPEKSSKRDIAKAFGIKGAARIDLKQMLKELEAEGHLMQRRRRFNDPNSLPPVSVLQMLGPDSQGDMFAVPLEWEGTGHLPKILMRSRQGDPALGQGDRLLARLTPVPDEDSHQYTGQLIRAIGTNPKRLLGIFRLTAEGGRIVAIDKGEGKEWLVAADAAGEAKDGELVEAEQSGPKGRLGLPRARVVERLGDPSAPKAVSLIAIHQHGIPDAFPDAVMAQADAAKPATSKGRVDLTDLPLITIDPADARDHDDACCALLDEDPKNPGGFLLWVAIADVAHYVTAGSALDAEARKRGNSTYFPDRVVPMLPDRLSGDLCSLHEGVTRPCIAVEMKLSSTGEKLSHRFVRGLMRSPASLSYEEAQAAVDGDPSERAAPLVDTVLSPLFGAYAALKQAREARQPLELDLPERKIILSDSGKVASVNFSERLDAHRLIEECMVLANVAAAETLIAKQQPLLFRVHEEPSPEKLDSLRETAKSVGLVLAKGQVLQTRHLNQLLKAAAGKDEAELINLSTLRSMTQAYYSSQNMSHFGLALQNYAHFTSPIRRYADLLLHRALVSAHGWATDGLSPQDIEMLDETAKHISETERRSMLAERDTTDRYLASFMSERVGNEFSGRISGVARFGIFVKLDETAADGLVPIRSLGREYFEHDADSQTLRGTDSGTVISLGQRVVVRLAETTPTTGGILLDLLELEDSKLQTGPRQRKIASASNRRGPKKGKSRKVTRKRQ